MSPAPRVYGYCRTSTDDKHQKPEMQAAAIAGYCAVQGLPAAEMLVDEGYSGGKGTDQRPGLKRLMELVRARQVDVLVVVKLDRLARSLSHLIALLDEFKALGVTFVSIGDQINMDTAIGKLTLHLVGAFAEFERSIIRDRVKAGLAYARSRGRKLGRPAATSDARILELRGEGRTYRQIAAQLGCSTATVRRALRDDDSKSLFEPAPALAGKACG